MKRIVTYFCSLAVPVALVYGGDYHKEIKRTSEQEVQVRIESAFGSVDVARGDKSKILVFDLQTERGRANSVDIDYRILNDVGRLNLDWNARHASSRVHVNDGGSEGRDYDLDAGKWFIKLNDELPLAIDAELGVGRGDFDLAGLNVKAFKLSTGACSTTLDFEEPNKGEIDDLQIESGVSKFVGRNLCNANFKRMSFEGGIGSYTLDFDGALDRKVEVHLKIGLGAVTVSIPRDIGARVFYDDKWFSSFTLDRDFSERHDGEYVTPNFESAKGRMDIYVDSGLGSVKIWRVK